MKHKGNDIERIFQLFERVENPFLNTINETIGVDDSGLEDKYFNSTDNSIYSDENFEHKLYQVNVISNATNEVKEIGNSPFYFVGESFWIIEHNSKMYLINTSPGKNLTTSTKRDKTEEFKKTGSGIIDSVWEITKK